jgi:hypothetical protein
MINEEINKIKYMFTYKPGVVISEQKPDNLMPGQPDNPLKINNVDYSKYSCVPIGFRPAVHNLLSKGYDKMLLKAALGVIGRESSYASGLRFNITSPLKTIASVLGIDTSIGVGQMKLSTVKDLNLKQNILTIEGALIGVYKYLKRSYKISIEKGYSTNKPSSNFNSGTGNAALDISIASYNMGIDKINKYCEQGLSKPIDKKNPRNTKEYWYDLMKKNPKMKKYYQEQIDKIDDLDFSQSGTNFMGKLMPNNDSIKVFCDSKNNRWVKNYLPNYPTKRWDNVDITTTGYVKEVAEKMKKITCF